MTTLFSADRVYRYTLWREWGDGNGVVQFIGLNPSTADETADDPTLRRCVAFARQIGCRALCMTNLFALRSTDPAGLKTSRDPVGPENDRHLLECAQSSALIIAAWGTGGRYLVRDAVVKGLLRRARERGEAPPLQCLRKTRSGHPAHPLYLPSQLTPIPL